MVSGSPRLLCAGGRRGSRSGADDDICRATRQIKAEPDLKSTPLIAVSSFAMKDDEAKARASGCDSCVTKPYSPMQLLRIIRGYLGQ